MESAKKTAADEAQDEDEKMDVEMNRSISLLSRMNSSDSAEVMEVEASAVSYHEAAVKESDSFSLTALMKTFDGLLISKTGEVIPVSFQAPEARPSEGGWNEINLWVHHMICELKQLTLK